MTAQKKDLAAGQLFLSVINAPVEFRDGGKRTRAPRLEAMVRRYAIAAARGDVTAAELLFKLHKHSKTNGDIQVETIFVPVKD